MRFRAAATSRLAFLTLFLATRADAVPTLWGVDGDDGVLFSMTNYTNLTGVTVYGPLLWNDGGNLEDLEEHIESFAIDPDGHTAYMSFNMPLGVPDPAIMFLTFDLLNASQITNMVVTVIGQFTPMLGEPDLIDDEDDNITGLRFDPTTGKFYALLRDEDRVDKLLELDKTTGEYKVVGNIKSDALQEKVEDGEDLVFDQFGNLYVTDNDDDELYRVNPLTGEILAVVDGDESGGIPGDVKIEGLAWDPTTNFLLGTEDEQNRWLHLTIPSDGVNSVIGTIPGLTDVEGIDFVPAAVPEPGTLTLLGLGMAGVWLGARRKD